MRRLAFSKRWSISESVHGTFHAGFRPATMPVMDKADSNLGGMSVG